MIRIAEEGRALCRGYQHIYVFIYSIYTLLYCCNICLKAAYIQNTTINIKYQLDFDCEALQSFVANSDSILRKKNIKLRGRKEEAEGEGLP